MTESDLWSLSQATEAGLFVSIEAARKAAHRDPRFPEPAATRGSAFLYDATALRAYREGTGRRPDLPSLPLRTEVPPPAADGPEWKPIPGAGYYEASHRGHVRSVDRTISGRFHKGVVLKPRVDGDGYLRVNITNDKGERRYNESVARLVLMAHDPDGYQEGMHSCHGPGGTKDNRWPENLRWDTPEANRQEALETRLANTPLKVKPPKVCPRCGAEHRDKGKNCHPCVVKIGTDGTGLIISGMRPDKIEAELGYPFIGVFNLAVTYGGLRFHREGHTPSRRSWLRRVTPGREPSRQNSDGA